MTIRRNLTILSAALIVLLVACGSDADSSSGEQSSTDVPTQNACPTDGCSIDFKEVEKAGDEIKVTWEINFAPDIDRNHVHIYWNNFVAAQVSNDATDRGVEQGEWVPTDSSPTYTTDGAASTSVRGDSTTLCLVAGDRDHNVIDVEAQTCRDVSDYL